MRGKLIILAPELPSLAKTLKLLIADQSTGGNCWEEKFFKECYIGEISR
jgi:hypothetical protein